MHGENDGMVPPSASPQEPWVVRYWWVWAILALFAGAVTTAAAQGFPIVDLEFAGSTERAAEVVGFVAVDTIRAAIYWDFLFIVLYALALATGALWASRRYANRRARSTGIVVAYGAVAAGLFDVVENTAMLAYLNGSGGWIPLARVMAIPKFLLTMIAVVYILGGVTALVVRRIRRPA